MIKCCKDCNERYSGCHDKCTRYLAEKSRNDRIRKEKQMRGYTYSYFKKKL
jgi:hypothetical protein